MTTPHHQTRVGDDNVYTREKHRAYAFASAIRTQQRLSSTGVPFDHVVQVGIGGSNLGPQALVLALDGWYRAAHAHLPLYRSSFVGNVDPDDVNTCLASIDFGRTLFIVVSKSGTTQETITNVDSIVRYAQQQGYAQDAISRHMVSVTQKGSPVDDPEQYMTSFCIDDHIGGRFSSTSCVGVVILSILYGPDAVESLLSGANRMDQHATTLPVAKNMCAMSALMGVLERNVYGYPAKAMVAYSQGLSRFVAHLQQLNCESNGKQVSIDHQPLNYKTGGIIFGEPGTDSQHSFFQMIHQGTDIIPVQFIGFRYPQIEEHCVGGDASQKKLNANLAAQVVALAMGQHSDHPHQRFDGGRPSSMVMADRLNPYTLGALLAFYENVVVFQGFIWNINSFDQEGVQLGKQLTQELLTAGRTPSPLLSAFFSLLDAQ